MREFHIRSHDWDPLRWPEAARGRVRPCPQCSNYQMEEPKCVGGASGYRYAYETFHFHNQTTAQWLTVELRLTDEHVFGYYLSFGITEKGLDNVRTSERPRSPSQKTRLVFFVKV